jgi:hypothetical protein
VGVLFNSLIEHPRVRGELDTLARRVMFYSIARTARPGDRAHSLIASNYAEMLLNRWQAPEDVAILTPAALRLPGDERAHLLLTLASRVYWNDDSTLADVSEPVREREMVKNLIVALQERSFEPLRREWPALAHEPFGRKLIAALVNREYGSLTLHDDHKFGFALDDGLSRIELPLIDEEDAEAIRPLRTPYIPGNGCISSLVKARGEAELRRALAA